jgi:ABC-type branched-subunit amino acid transport system substrate-binding protein
MTKKLKLCAVALFIALASLAASSVLSSGASAAQVGGAQGAKAAPMAAGLTAQERRGRVIYLRGESAAGREIKALVGEIDVPASTLTCAGCHGTRGEGKTEGGVTAGDLTWANLTKPYGHTHPTGRKHGPFNEAAFFRAISEGIDPAGNTMLAAMPRYTMSAEDGADLLAYLKRIEEDRDPGLTDSSLKVGMIIPTKGALAESGAAMRDVLAGYFEEINGRGGIYGRRIELQIAESGADAAAMSASARRLIEEGQVFALVSGLSAGADRELGSVARELEVPFVGPSTLLPQSAPGSNRYIFYMLPGVSEQARALVNFYARRQPEAQKKVALVYSGGEVEEVASAAVEEQCKSAGCGALQKISYARGKFDAPSLVRSLKGADAVFFFGASGDETTFIKEADADGWHPSVLMLGMMTGRELAASVPAGFKDKIFLAFPTVPSDITAAGEAELRALVQKYKFNIRHTAAQLSALAAGKVLVEGLQRSGKDLSREKLVTALEGLYDYETGMTPLITYGPNRRIGAAGAYIIGVDTERKEFVSVSGWVKAN